MRALWRVSDADARGAESTRQRGLVRLTPNRGAVISELTLQDLEDAFPVMGALEALAGELACVHITDREIAEIRKLCRIAWRSASKIVSSHLTLN